MATKKKATRKKSATRIMKNVHKTIMADTNKKVKQLTKSLHTRRGWKLDQAKISSAKYEIDYIRLIFYKKLGPDFVHPLELGVRQIVKKCNNSRMRTYALLKELGWSRIQKPKP